MTAPIACIGGGGMRAGLGWIPGTFCPHLDSEAWRQQLLAGAPATPAYGAPEGVVLRFDDGAMTEAVADKDGATATLRLAGEPALRTIPARSLLQAPSAN